MRDAGGGGARPCGVEEILRARLSVRHRDSPEHGCPPASLLDEIARCAEATRRAYTDEVLPVIDDAARVVPHDPRSAGVQAFSVYALMVGTLQLSRALVDQRLADVVLDIVPTRHVFPTADTAFGVAVSRPCGSFGLP
ncbi:hypothetical protein [Streptomyces caniscabiei]|uniref:hypothetical protein n=1 Tax=Streptomyces caniscabiei TaxID=2746961 RepID=UPI0007C8154A|nr:hypothetical protein [Streptomyces caniscabiei]